MPTTRPYSSPYCGMFSTGSSKPKKQVPTHGRSVNRMYCSTRGMLPRAGGAGQDSRLRLRARRIVCRPAQKAGRNASGGCGCTHAGQNRGRPDRAAVVHAALDLVPQLGMEDQPLGHADGGDQRIAGFHRHGQLLDQPGVEPVPHAAIVGDLHPGGRIEHEAVADALASGAPCPSRPARVWQSRRRRAAWGRSP